MVKVDFPGSGDSPFWPSFTGFVNPICLQRYLRCWESAEFCCGYIANFKVGIGIVVGVVLRR